MVLGSGMMIGMEAALPPLIQALLQPVRYPHRPESVALVQTHISWVLLAGDFAYKIKKPVTLSFLDFSTLALRHQACLEELRLNRRFAPDIYLDVVAIYNTVDEPQFDPGGEVIDYAVRMRRFDEAARLDRVCARGELRPAQLSDLAQALAAFHASAAKAPAHSTWGTPAQVLAPMRDNFTDLLHGLPDAGWQARVQALQVWTEAQGAQLEPMIGQRKRVGCVRECHGDLHLANLVLIDQRVRMFDCIEFNAGLRWIDVLSDVAFVYADLLAHRCTGLASWFANAVLSLGGDYRAAALLRFYAVYRCMVRAKVAALRNQQTGDDSALVLDQVALAERLAAPRVQRLLITHGLSGSGKTTLTDQLLQSDAGDNTVRLRADVERKRLYGLSAQTRSHCGLNSGLYAADAHALTYAHLRERAAELLGAGWSVVVDATFLMQADRDSFRALAAEWGATFGIVAPQATPAQLRQRIILRNALGHDASEATVQVLEQQLDRVEPLTADEQTTVVLIRP